jgi:hypothetical protein
MNFCVVLDPQTVKNKNGSLGKYLASMLGEINAINEMVLLHACDEESHNLGSQIEDKLKQLKGRNFLHSMGISALKGKDPYGHLKSEIENEIETFSNKTILLLPEEEGFLTILKTVKECKKSIRGLVVVSATEPIATVA